MCSMPMVRRILASLGGHSLKRCGNLGVRVAIQGNARLRSTRLFQLLGDPPSPARAGHLSQLIDVTRLAGNRQPSLSPGCGVSVGMSVSVSGHQTLASLGGYSLKKCDVRQPPASRAPVLPAPAKGRQHFNAGKRA